MVRIDLELVRRNLMTVAGDIAHRVPNDHAQLFAFAASPKVRAQPWDVYRRLHDRGAVRPTPFGAWIVGSHAGVRDVLLHPMTSVDESLATGLEGAGESDDFSTLMQRTLLFRDPPDHTRLRRTISRAFSPQFTESLRSGIEQTVDSMIADASRAGSADLIAALGLPLPVAVICDLLGVLQGDRDRFLYWARGLAPRLDVRLFRDQAVNERGNQAARELSSLLAELVEDGSRRSSDGMLTRLVEADVDGERLRVDEVIALAALLLVAGFETTTNLIGNGVHALLEHPEQCSAVRRGDVDIPVAIDELLRFCGPVQLTQRVLLEDLEIEGFELPDRTLVALLIGAANRDPQVFERPDDLLVDRDPNPHLAFSLGAHHCLGSQLARIEAEVAIPAVLRAWPNLRLAGPVRWRSSFVLRGLETLPVAWSA